MKKNGFTITELIIALGIIGVLSAMTLPSLSNLLPDKDKIEVLKIHKTITEINQEILQNRDWLTNSHVLDSNNKPICEGLECLSAPDSFKESSIEKKFPYLKLFSDKLHKKGYDYTKSKIKTANGQEWFITHNDGTWYITVDLMNGNAHKVYGEDDTTKPGRFSFAIDKYGHVSGNDPLTTAYLLDIDQTNNKRKNYEIASKDKTVYHTKYEEGTKPSLNKPGKKTVEAMFKPIKITTEQKQ